MLKRIKSFLNYLVIVLWYEDLQFRFTSCSVYPEVVLKENDSKHNTKNNIIYTVLCKMQQICYIHNVVQMQLISYIHNAFD